MNVTIRVGTYVNGQKVVEREYGISHDTSDKKIILNSIALDDIGDEILNDTEDFMNAQNDL